MKTGKQFKTFRSFYPHYLSEHANSTNRKLHFAGTALLLFCALIAIITGKYWLFILIPVLGYGFAWFGHFFIEKNRPATFTYPLYSLASDFVMFWHMITGRLERKMKEAEIKEHNNHAHK